MPRIPRRFRGSLRAAAIVVLALTLLAACKRDVVGPSPIDVPVAGAVETVYTNIPKHAINAATVEFDVVATIGPVRDAIIRVDEDWPIDSAWSHEPADCAAGHTCHVGPVSVDPSAFATETRPTYVTFGDTNASNGTDTYRVEHLVFHITWGE